MRSLPPRDMALATLTSIIWGLAFVAIKFGLDGFSAPQLTAMRFIVAALPALFIPPPKLSLASIVLIGSTLFAGQFLLLFFAYAAGLPPGLASVSQQMQAFFTVLLAARISGRSAEPAAMRRRWRWPLPGSALVALTVGRGFAGTSRWALRLPARSAGRSAMCWSSAMPRFRCFPSSSGAASCRRCPLSSFHSSRSVDRRCPSRWPMPRG